MHIRAPDRTIGAKKMPFLKSSEVRWDNLGFFAGLCEGEADRELGCLAMKESSLRIMGGAKGHMSEPFIGGSLGLRAESAKIHIYFQEPD